MVQNYGSREKTVIKADIHVHTFESSKCGKSKAEDIVSTYKEFGYDLIVITDHFFTGNTKVPKDLPWEEKAHLLFEGYREAKKYGDKVGLKVFYGFEYPDKGSDFLIFGIDEKFIASHPEIAEMGIVEVLKLFRENGGFVIHAHPFRFGKYQQSKGIHLYPDCVDAVEVYNGAHGLKCGKYDPKANEYAKYYAMNTGLLQTAGSDTHDVNVMYGGGMLFERMPESMEELICMIRNNEFEISES